MAISSLNGMFNPDPTGHQQNLPQQRRHLELKLKLDLDQEQNLKKLQGQDLDQGTAWE